MTKVEKTLAINRLLLAGIAGVAASVSYLTQRDLLEENGADEFSAHAIPFTVDLAVIVCSLVINTPEIDPDARKMAWIVLGVACAMSVVANCYAGENLIQRIAHVWCVVIYLGTEAVASRARARRAEAKAAAPARRKAATKPAPAAETGQEVVQSAQKPPRATGPRGRTKVTPIEEIEATKQKQNGSRYVRPTQAPEESDHARVAATVAAVV